MIATTISNSISEKPFCFRIIVCPRLRLVCDGRLTISLVTIALSLPEKSDESDARLCRQALPFRLLAGFGNLSRVVIDLNLTLHGCSIDNIWHLKRERLVAAGGLIRKHLSQKLAVVVPAMDRSSIVFGKSENNH
jgi:hypothetical protein